MGQIFEAGGPFWVTGGPFGPPVNMVAEALECRAFTESKVITENYFSQNLFFSFCPLEAKLLILDEI